jgi:aldose 1-epimerase
MTGRRWLTLRSEELEVVILPDAGGRIHRIRAFGEDLLRTPDDPAVHGAEPFFWGAYVMAPWSNRARSGPMEVAGRPVELEPNFPDGTAIHGLVASAPWDRDGDTGLAIRLDAGLRWPWAFEARQVATVDGPTVEVTYGLRNLERDASMPAGLGLHPWFRRPIELRIAAERAYSSNSDSPPQPVAVAGDLDLRSLRPPPGDVDATLTGLSEPRIDLAWPSLGLSARLEIETDAAGVLVAVATPSDLDAIAVEPQTHGPDPLRRLAAGEPDPPALLPPGGSMSLAVRLTVARAYR